MLVKERSQVYGQVGELRMQTAQELCDIQEDGLWHQSKVRENF